MYICIYTHVVISSITVALISMGPNPHPPRTPRARSGRVRRGRAQMVDGGPIAIDRADTLQHAGPPCTQVERGKAGFATSGVGCHRWSVSAQDQRGWTSCRSRNTRWSSWQELKKGLRLHGMKGGSRRTCARGNANVRGLRGRPPPFRWG